MDLVESAKRRETGRKRLFYLLFPHMRKCASRSGRDMTQATPTKQFFSYSHVFRGGAVVNTSIRITTVTVVVEDWLALVLFKS